MAGNSPRLYLPFALLLCTVGFATICHATPVLTNTGPGGFEETNVASDLRLWLNAGAGVTGTTPVTKWTDQTVNAFEFTQAVNGPALISSVSGLSNQPALRFD